MTTPVPTLKPMKMIFPKGDYKSLRYNPYNKNYVRPKTKRKSNLPCKHTNFIKYSSLQISDDIWVGDDMNSQPHNQHARFWIQNCQGMVTDRDINQYHFELQKYLE